MGFAGIAVGAAMVNFSFENSNKIIYVNFVLSAWFETHLRIHDLQLFNASNRSGLSLKEEMSKYLSFSFNRLLIQLQKHTICQPAQSKSP